MCTVRLQAAVSRKTDEPARWPDDAHAAPPLHTCACRSKPLVEASTIARSTHGIALRTSRARPGRTSALATHGTPCALAPLRHARNASRVSCACALLRHARNNSHLVHARSAAPQTATPRVNCALAVRFATQGTPCTLFAHALRCATHITPRPSVAHSLRFATHGTRRLRTRCALPRTERHGTAH